ncbi:hypothetical protein C8R45DRAFT_948220 [Mycena sanguinolenta]|nr:hypothetical protein C8R45DRAFT_948220 [Mycena sanguinolenta]
MEPGESEEQWAADGKEEEGWVMGDNGIVTSVNNLTRLGCAIERHQLWRHGGRTEGASGVQDDDDPGEAEEMGEKSIIQEAKLNPINVRTLGGADDGQGLGLRMAKGLQRRVDMQRKLETASSGFAHSKARVRDLIERNTRVSSSRITTETGSRELAESRADTYRLGVRPKRLFKDHVANAVTSPVVGMPGVISEEQRDQNTKQK